MDYTITVSGAEIEEIIKERILGLGFPMNDKAVMNIQYSRGTFNVAVDLDPKPVKETPKREPQNSTGKPLKEVDPEPFKEDIAPKEETKRTPPVTKAAAKKEEPVEKEEDVTPDTVEFDEKPVVESDDDTLFDEPIDGEPQGDDDNIFD